MSFFLFSWSVLVLLLLYLLFSLCQLFNIFYDHMQTETKHTERRNGKPKDGKEQKQSSTVVLCLLQMTIISLVYLHNLTHMETNERKIQTTSKIQNWQSQRDNDFPFALFSGIWLLHRFNQTQWNVEYILSPKKSKSMNPCIAIKNELN